MSLNHQVHHGFGSDLMSANSKHNVIPFINPQLSKLGQVGYNRLRPTPIPAPVGKKVLAFDLLLLTLEK